MRKMNTGSDSLEKTKERVEEVDQNNKSIFTPQGDQENNTGKKKTILKIILAFLLLLSAGSLLIYFKFQKSYLISKNRTELISNTKTWINCNDVRDVVEDSDYIYVGCLGGILVIEKNSGEIFDELNFQDGMDSETVTDLVLHENKIYVGSQAGLHIFDLEKRTFDVVNQSNGLPSNSNIVLAKDEEYIWIGTFNGLARWDINNEKIEDFTDDLPSGQRDLHGVLVTPNSVYAYGQKNIYRYDKNDKYWEEVKYNNQNIVISDLSYHDDIIFVYAWDDIVLSGKNASNSILNEYSPIINGLNSTGSSLYTSRYIGTYENYDYLIGTSGIYRFNFLNNNIELFSSENSTIGINFPILTDKLWEFSEISSDDWMTTYDLESGEKQVYKLERPSKFKSALGIIESSNHSSTNKLLISSEAALYMGSLEGDEVEKKTKFFVLNQWEGSGNNIEYQVVPLMNSNKFVFYSEDCQMECARSDMFLYDYINNKTSKIDTSELVEQDYDGLTEDVFSFKGLDEDNNPWFILGKNLFSIDSNGKIQNIHQDFSYETIEEENITIVTKKNNEIDCGFVATFDEQLKIFKDVSYPDCDMNNLIDMPNAITSLINIGDKVIGTYQWGGLFITGE